MTEVYVIRNQHGHYWAKSKEWVDGSEPRTVMRAKGISNPVLSFEEIGLDARPALVGVVAA